MAVPSAYPITITINGVDVTSAVPYESINFDDRAQEVSTFDFVLKGDDLVTPARQHAVIVRNATTTALLFLGFIIDLKEGKQDNGIALEYELKSADYKYRLQKTVLGYKEYSGSDADILSDLLTDAYPDLSSLFDFSTDVDSIASALNFTTQDDNLLDAISKLSDIAGGLDFSFNLADALGGTVTFDAGGYAEYTTEFTAGWTAGINAVGNPDNAYQATRAATPASQLDGIKVTVDLEADYLVSAISFDVYGERDGADANFGVNVQDVTYGQFNVNPDSSPTTNGTWTAQADTNLGLPLTLQVIEFYLYVQAAPMTTNYDLRIDNITITADGFGGDPKLNLKWGTPDAADFDIDVQSSNEFAFDMSLEVGDFDDFNSVTVIGGAEDVAIDRTYDNSGYQEHVKLESPVKSPVVYLNGGSDGTPNWGSALLLGTWGTDDIIDDSGSKNVLYDPDKHWLLFDSSSQPPALGKSIRLTGTISKPIRVRVEDVADGENVYATTLYDSSVTSTDDALAAGNAQLEARNAPKRLTFNTYHPGLLPGKTMTVADSARGLSESLTIQRVQTTWLGGSGHAKYAVEAGDDDATGIDTLIANNDKRSRENALRAATPTTTIKVLTDANGISVTDATGKVIHGF